MSDQGWGLGYPWHPTPQQFLRKPSLPKGPAQPGPGRVLWGSGLAFALFEHLLGIVGHAVHTSEKTMWLGARLRLRLGGGGGGGRVFETCL